MNFRREKIREYYLHNTDVENVFINEYMTTAPGDFVKVYLFALMYAGISVPISNEDIAKELEMDPEDVLKAWSYWEERKVVRKQFFSDDDRYRYRVEFLNLKEQIYGKNGKNGKHRRQKTELPENLQALMEDSALREMYGEIEQITGRLFSGKETEDLAALIRDYGIPPELIVFGYSYCNTRRGNNKPKYVEAVLKDWAGQDLKTVEKVEEFLEGTDSRHFLYKRVLKALGFMRNPTEEEKRIMDTWFDQMEFSIEQVLEACKKTSGISNPNIKYVNSVIKSRHEEKQKDGGGGLPSGAGLQQALRSYEEERLRNEAQARRRREEVYRALPRIAEIDDAVKGLVVEISRQVLSGGDSSRGKVRDLKMKNEALLKEKEALLEQNNYEKNYTDIWYTCPVCKDTGILDTGEHCPCLQKKLSGE